MLVEKIVATEGNPVAGCAAAGGAVVQTLASLGIGTSIEAFVHALRHQLHQVVDQPFSALASAMPPAEFVADLRALGVEPIYIAIACKRMADMGALPSPNLQAEVDRAVEDYVASVVYGS